MKGSVGSALKPSLDAIQQLKERSLVKSSAKVSKIIENNELFGVKIVKILGFIYKFMQLFPRFLDSHPLFWV